MEYSSIKLTIENLLDFISLIFSLMLFRPLVHTPVKNL